MSDVFVLDTNALLYFGSGQLTKLGKRAREVFDRCRHGDAVAVVPAIVLVELWHLLKAGRFRVETTLEAWWTRVAEGGVLSTELTAEDVMRATVLSWEHRDPFDRLIVATALRYGCPLVTKDSAIAEWGGIEVVW